jgi:hypothetical protein
VEKSLCKQSGAADNYGCFYRCSYQNPSKQYGGYAIANYAGADDGDNAIANYAGADDGDNALANHAGANCCDTDKYSWYSNAHQYGERSNANKYSGNASPPSGFRPITM